MNRHFIGPLTEAQMRQRLRSRKTFAEFNEFTDAYYVNFKQWLEIRKSHWYRDILSGGSGDRPGAGEYP